MNLIPIEYHSQRILTTEQLAEVYKTDVNNIQANFKRNECHFSEGIHFFRLEGEVLKEFKNQPTISQLVSKHASQLYLWTERGANRHCKILDTDKAWEQFDRLEETYFKPRQLVQSVEDLIILQAQSMKEIRLAQKQQAAAITDHEFKIADIDQKVTHQITITTAEQKRVQGAVNSRARNLGIPDAYRQIYGALKKQFNVPSYRDLKRSDLSKAFTFIQSWSPGRNYR